MPKDPDILAAIAAADHNEALGRLLIAGTWVDGAARIDVEDRFEIFGPVVCLIPFEAPEEAFQDINNETSSSRVDVMPYGGTKQSGFGREGPAYAIRETSEERLVAIAP